MRKWADPRRSFPHPTKQKAQHSDVQWCFGVTICRFKRISAHSLRIQPNFCKVCVEMLIQFRVENHRSLKNEQTLTLSAATTVPEERALRTPAIREPLLPAVAIYGANASGKTNVLNAFAFMRDAVVDSHRAWEPDGGVPNEPFALSSRRGDPSLYEVDVVANGVRHRYGFVCDSNQILEEWLFAWPNGHKQTWFTREGENFRFGRHLVGDQDAIRKLTRNNSLFVAVAAQNNHEQLMPLYRWFRTTQVDYRRSSRLSGLPLSMFADAFSRQLSLFAHDDHDERRAIMDLLQAADTGITDIKVETGGDVASPRQVRRRAQIFLRHKAEDSSEEEAWLPLEVESSGTIALIELAPRLMRALAVGGVIFIDELEGSLHPMLAVSLLSLFNDPSRNRGKAQLIFTTHDTNLLGNTLGQTPLRRDQVWFTEKDASGATELYPLTDFHPRRQENLERGYLQGRYGAIPFIGALAPQERVSED